MSRPNKVFHRCMPAFRVWTVRNRLPVILHRLADMQAMFRALGLVCRGLANLLPVLVRELPVLPLEFFHILPDAYMSASTNKYANPRKKEKCSSR